MGQPLWKGDKATRTLIAKEYVKYYATRRIIQMLGSMAGAATGGILNPFTNLTDPDAEKLKWGHMRVDPSSGLSTTVRFGAREMAAITGDPKYKGKGGDVALRFARSKLSRKGQLVVEIVTGKDFRGAEVTKLQAVKNFFFAVPLQYQDVKDAFDIEGPGKALAAFALAFQGEGVSTYDETKKKDRHH